MSQKSEKASKETSGGWDNDSDAEWDDWGDAEDGTTREEAQESSNKGGNHDAIKERRHQSMESSTPQEEQQKRAEKSSSWWGGLSTVLSTATEGLGSITNTVSQGLNQVIGVPDPEELARINADKEEKDKAEAKSDKDNVQVIANEKKEEETPVFGGLVNLQMVSSLGSKVLNTGLDTLEGIGKKTMTILQENDPGLKNKRKLLGLEPGDKPNLSEVLKEARNQSELLENQIKELKLERSRELLRFELIFENNCGLVHLEALEILSKESICKLEAMLESVTGRALLELQETIEAVKELFEMEDLEVESVEGVYTEEELNGKLLTAMEDAGLQLSFDDITSHWSRSLEYFTSMPSSTPTSHDIFAKALTALAECCALEICKLHKIAELLLIKEHHSTASEVDGIVQLCKQFSCHLNGLTHRYVAILNSTSEADSDEVKGHINSLFAEMVVAQHYVEKAFKLFLPILQMGAV